VSASVLSSQFTSKKAVGAKTAKVFKKNPPKTIADAVYDQLTEDYPKDALNWVHDIKWKGPMEVPSTKIDMADRDSWKASHEPEVVDQWKKRISSAEKKGEHVKPVVLIQRKGKKIFPTDGHHRTLAYYEENKPVYAWVGMPTRTKGPWLSLHDKQFKKESGPRKGGNPGLYHYGREPR